MGEVIEDWLTSVKMNSDRQTAIIVGVLFITAIVFLFIGGAIYNPILSSPDYLDNAYPNKTIVIIGILLEFICVLATVLIPVFMFPILKKHNEQLALGYVGFRFLEAVLFAVSQISLLLLLTLSQEYVAAGAPDASSFQALGALLLAAHYWAFLLGPGAIVFTLGALMFYYVLYKSKLIPRFISAWGFIAAAVLLTGSVLIMGGLFTGISELGLNLILALPIASNEIVLAIWLIVKGFDSSAIAS